ncbi:hypothetical protein B0H17DRAFT_1156954 [Mycena rosella]|uniref:Uncharacterized protein n=1 Tax=Mycena rosella TaxID=1033263 RepID=A0AAD7GTN9_MYCRO|nr:hypothetical protein B0H17DRAFT_1156954 [Mycena rosella]
MTHPFAHSDNDSRTNETLICHGYIGASPEIVSVAFPIALFDVYRQIHRVCPRYSLGALSRTLTNLAQLSTAYDAYLEIMRRVDASAQRAMGRDSGWYMQNVCALCFYKTKNETPLQFSWLGCMDGNNSLKLIDSTFRAGTVRLDNRSAASARWLSPQQVDIFKDEVAQAQKVRNDGNVAWLNVNELSGAEAEELAKCLDTCVERWKAAGPEARKKMFALLAISGIFLTVCRHGHVVVMCDMIRSGELMKYPLAMVRHLIDHYGTDIGIGYDIMCAFWKTLRRSSLGADVTTMRFRGVVPAFHGHAHNRACQIGWHPLYVDGVGLEDFEECERTFALSNHLVSSTRLATVFHRQQQIEEHFQFHDQDKHAMSGNFIYQNYRQALKKIALNREQLAELERTLGTTAEDYEKDHLAEVNYFESLRSEPKEIQQTADYMECLRKIHAATEASDRAKVEFQRLDWNIANSGYLKPQIAAVRTRYRTTYTRYLAIEEEVCWFEDEHKIELRWTPESAEYKAALIVTTERRYQTALAEVERLVVQRLFELTKLGMSGIAYKLRDKISKGLNTRSEAIRRALVAYNEAGALLTRPRPRLTFLDIIHNTTLAEFDLLRETRQDIRNQAWTQPARREAGVLYYGIKRAKEEIRRLNVEITRLITSLVDEHVDYYHTIASTLLTDPELAEELQRRWMHATRISTTICKRLASTARLVGFSGSDPTRGDDVPPPDWLAAVLGITLTEVQYDESEGTELGTERVYDDEDESGLVVRELEIDEDSLADLMDHLSTFDDSK